MRSLLIFQFLSKVIKSLNFIKLRTDINRSKETINRGIITLIDQAITSANSFIAGIIIGRACGKDEFGLYVLGLTIVTFVISFQSSLITTPYMIQIARLKGTEKDSFTGSTFIHELMISLTVTLLIMIASFFILYRNSQMFKVLLSLAAGIPFIVMREYIRQISLARLHAVSVLILDSLILCIQIVVLLMLAGNDMLSASRAFLVIGFSCGVSGISLLIWRRHWFIFKWREVHSHLSQNFHVGRWILGGILIYTLAKETYPWMLTSFHSTAATATFGACMGVIFLSNPFILGMTNFMSPVIVHSYSDNDKHKLSNIILKCTIFMVFVMGSFCIALFIFGGKLVVFIYGVKYAGNELLISILGLSTLATVFTLPVGIGLYAMNRADVTFKACLSSLFVTISIGILLVKHMGVIGGAVSLLVGNIIESIFKYYKYAKTE